MRQVAIILFVFVVLVSSLDAAPAKEKEWTFAVFMNGDNDLDPFAVKDQEEMSQVGSSDGLNIVTLIDRNNAPASLNFIEKGKIQLLKDMGEIDMGDFRELTKFVKFVAENYPARHYIVIVWNHGMGWADKSGGRQVFKGISIDWDSGNRITTAQLGQASAEMKNILGGKLDILAMDACLMQMAEVALVIKDSCDFIIASEESEPADGYPYTDILKALKKGVTPLVMAKTIVARFAASYDGGSQGKEPTTQSALQSAKLPPVYDGINGLAKALMAGSFATSCQAIRGKVQRIDGGHIDLLDFVDLVKAEIKDEGVQTAADKLGQALTAAIVANGTSGAKVKNAKGLAIYFPSKSHEFGKEYNMTAFAEMSLWDEFLLDYYKKTTAPMILAAIESGDVSPLLEYSRTATGDNAEVSADLMERLNFRVFSEGGLPPSTQGIVRNVVTQLKTLR
jgi:hypothetical protein